MCYNYGNNIIIRKHDMLKQFMNCITHCYKKGEVIMTIALKIAITIIAAVLVLPIEYFIFPKLERQEVKEETETMEMLKIISIILILIMLSGISIMISVYVLFVSEREIWYRYLIPMAYPIFWKFAFACTDLQKRLLPFVLPILAIAFIGCIMLPIRDNIIVYEPEVLTTYRQVWEEPVLSEAQIKARLNALSISELSYDCDEAKYIYEINKWKSGYGLAVVKGQNMEFIPCKYQNQTSGRVREHYPKEEIVEIGIQLQTENEETIPYAKFGILKRPHMFSKPEIHFYVLLNMQSGEVTKQSK